MTAPNALDTHIGSRVRARRIELLIGREQLAAMLGATNRELQEWETGARRIGAERLRQLAGILDVDPVFFFVGAETPKSVH